MSEKAIPSKFTLKVLNDLYLIEEDEMTKYEGQLEIPDEYAAYYEKVSDRGTVVTRGDTTRYQLKPGQRVIFGRYAGQRL